MGAEAPWDVWDRVVPALLFSHAAAALLTGVLNIPTAALFLCLAAVAVAATLCYHNLKVTAAGKGVLITGCDSRIGFALARRLDELGFTVFAGFMHLDDPLAEKLRESSSGRLHLLQLDVTSEEEIQAASNYVKEHLPPGTIGLWAVVNNASWASFGEVEWVPFPVFRRAAEVNLLSAIRVTQVFLPSIRRTKGRVVNLVSILGRITGPLRSSYCAAKFGVEAFSDCLRLEMRRWGVDVVVIEPGDYATINPWYNDENLLQQAREMWHQMTAEARDEYGEDYFERKIRSMEQYTKGPEADVEPVVQALTDAALRTFPLQRYTPVSRAEKLQAFVADHLPHSVYDLLYN